MFQLPQPELWDALITAVEAILLPQDQDRGPLPYQSLPASGDGNSLSNMTCRVIAEIQTRTCLALSLYLEDVDFATEFIQRCESAIDILKSLSKECSAGNANLLGFKYKNIYFVGVKRICLPF